MNVDSGGVVNGAVCCKPILEDRLVRFLLDNLVGT